MFVPSVIERVTRTQRQDGRHVIEIDEDDFMPILRQALQTIPVDEVWYLARNPDVKEAVKKGKVRSGRQHYIEKGYFEGREPYEIYFDEEYYLREYPDVKLALQNKSVSSARMHFEENGLKEGRLPHRGFSLFVASKPTSGNTRAVAR